LRLSNATSNTGLTCFLLLPSVSRETGHVALSPIVRLPRLFISSRSISRRGSSFFSMPSVWSSAYAGVRQRIADSRPSSDDAEINSVPQLYCLSPLLHHWWGLGYITSQASREAPHRNQCLHPMASPDQLLCVGQSPTALEPKRLPTPTIYRGKF
jgi:hypothetical protein